MKIPDISPNAFVTEEAKHLLSSNGQNAYFKVESVFMEEEHKAFDYFSSPP